MTLVFGSPWLWRHAMVSGGEADDNRSPDCAPKRNRQHGDWASGRVPLVSVNTATLDLPLTLNQRKLFYVTAM